MRATFADTSLHVSLANPRDVNHRAAVTLAGDIRSRIVTTEYVLVELGNWLSRSGDRAAFLILMDQIREDPVISVAWASPELFGRGMDVYRQRPDKDWSLTDCISFAFMKEGGITDALTADHHFEQAGFRALLA